MKKMYKVDLENKLLKKYFLTPQRTELLKVLYKEKNNSIKSQYEIDLLENEIQMFLSKKELSDSEKDMLHYIKKFYNNNLGKSIDNFLDSPIYNDENCLTKIFDKNVIKYIRTEKENKIEQAKKCIEKYISEKKITEEEYEIMFTYLNSEYTNVFSRELKDKIKKILEIIFTKDKKNNVHEIKFALNYIHREQAHWKGYEPCKLYLDCYIPYFDNGEVKTMDFKSITNGGAYINKENIIIINTAHIAMKKTRNVTEYGQNLLRQILLVSHESWHNKQFDDAIENRYTIDNFEHVIHNLFYEDKLYFINYQFLKTEHRADENGYSNQLDYLVRYRFNEREIEFLKQQTRKNLVRDSYDIYIRNEIDNPEFYVENYNYIICNLEKKCIKNNVLLSKYPILKLFFNNNGKLKTLDELLDSYSKLNEEKKYFDYECDSVKLFEHFINYILKDYPLESRENVTPINTRLTILLEKIIEQELEQIKLLLSDSEEHKRLEYCMKEYKINLSEERIKILKEKVARINKYIKYIYNYNENNKLVNNRIQLLKTNIDTLNIKNI